MLKLDISHIYETVSQDEIYSYQKAVTGANEMLYNKTGKGSDYLGWLELPSNVSKDEITQIKDCASSLAGKSEIIVVIGIGGSYLGARAVIDALSNNFNSLLSKNERKAPLILFAGENISEDYHAELLGVLNDRDYSIIVISKSGTTTEPAIAFRLLKNHIEKKYGKTEAKTRIAAVTDKAKGALKKLADAEGYQTFVIPDDVGGRFSVLTPVGLLPIAAAGFDIDALLNGAKAMQQLTRDKKSMDENPADLYAAVRNALYNKGKSIEILAGYTPNLNYVVEWWKQLYGESEGKEGKGIFPAGVNFTADLHSMGQWMQEGTRSIFETVISIQNSTHNLTVPSDKGNLDEMNYISGKRLSEVNKMAELGTMLAHVEGGVPNIAISLNKIDEENLGELIYFFEKACAVSGYVLGVNPFDQPGVEAYKKNMFALLGKPGFEDMKRVLESKLKQS
ncbi:MAG TPA: glucose-6-phosphate isomerase [Ignavibacteria bacterium]|nr:glucose-6-phosphate isomerase [Ignavibacteria bacterium]HMQ99428.1 glucose-6-phosphate isomerase [Ignavibacteria bacterium]